MVNIICILFIAWTLCLNLCTSQPVPNDEKAVEPKFLGLTALYGGILAAGLVNNGGWNSGGGHHKPGHGQHKPGHGGHGQQSGNFLGQLTGGWGGCKRKC